jgi:hypothetical protein
MPTLAVQSNIEQERAADLESPFGAFIRLFLIGRAKEYSRFLVIGEVDLFRAC